MPRGQLYVSKFSIVKLGRCIRGIQLRTKPEESESSDEDHFLLCLSENLTLSSVVRHDAVACESYCITGSYESTHRNARAATANIATLLCNKLNTSDIAQEVDGQRPKT